MAGGDIGGGKTIRATDDFGFAAVDDKVHVNDLHATMLGLIGIDHEELTYLFEVRLFFTVTVVPSLIVEGHMMQALRGNRFRQLMSSGQSWNY